MEWEIDEYMEEVVQESFSDVFSSAKVFIRRALTTAADMLNKFADEVRRKSDNLWRRLSTWFDTLLKKYEREGVEVTEDAYDDINETLDEFINNMDETTTIIVRHSDDYDRPIGTEGDVQMFEDDNNDLDGCGDTFTHLSSVKARVGKKKKVKLGTKFFREIKNKFKQSYHKNMASMKRLSTKQMKAAERSEFMTISEVVNRLCTAIMNVAYTIIAVVKASLECAGAIITMITHAVLQAKGNTLKDVSDQGITIDPIIMGV